MAVDEFDQQIDDPEQISQTQRIKEILDRRAEVLQARDEAKQRALFDDNVTEIKALLYYRSHLESLVHELWNVFRNLDRNDGEDTGEKYLKDEVIGTFEIHPPDELREEIDQLAPTAHYPDVKTVTMEGLIWLIEAPETITAEFTAEALDPPKTVTKTNDYVLQWSELDAALRYALEFIDVAGIDADLAEQEQRTKIDRELLEELDEWRQENIDT